MRARLSILQHTKRYAECLRHSAFYSTQKQQKNKLKKIQSPNETEIKHFTAHKNIIKMSATFCILQHTKTTKNQLFKKSPNLSISFTAFYSTQKRI